MFQQTHRNFIYNEERGFIFAYVPKVACTNWKSLLRLMAGHGDWLDPKRAHDMQGSGLRFIDPRGPEAGLLRDPGIRRYAMVRDPVTRTLSAYLNKIEPRLPPKPQGEGDPFDLCARRIDRFRRQVLGPRRHPEVTYAVFLHWLSMAEGRPTGDPHWAPQTLLLRHGEIRYDYIGRFEALESDARIILDAMGCDQPFPTQAEVSFKPTEATRKVDRYYDAQTRALIAELFAADFDAFGYSRP